MKIDITYPAKRDCPPRRSDIINVARWPFLLTAYICPIINVCAGGPAWSVVVLWSLWLAWSLAFSPAMVEYNRISQAIKLITNISILLILIDVLLSPGWAISVVPIVCFCGLAVVGVLFFTDIDKQKHNMLPMVLLSIVSFLCAVGGLIIWRGESRWELVVLSALAFALLAACFLKLGGDMLGEFKKRFHTD